MSLHPNRNESFKVSSNQNQDSTELEWNNSAQQNSSASYAIQIQENGCTRTNVSENGQLRLIEVETK